MPRAPGPLTSPKTIPDLNCMHCGWPLIKEGKLKCTRSKHTVLATPGKKRMLCPHCWNPRVLLAKDSHAVCPKCGKLTPFVTTEDYQVSKEKKSVAQKEDRIDPEIANQIKTIAEKATKLTRELKAFLSCLPSKWVRENHKPPYINFSYSSKFLGDRNLCINLRTIDFIGVYGVFLSVGVAQGYRSWHFFAITNQERLIEILSSLRPVPFGIMWVRSPEPSNPSLKEQKVLLRTIERAIDYFDKKCSEKILLPIINSMSREAKELYANAVFAHIRKQEEEDRRVEEMRKRWLGEQKKPS